MNSRSLAFFLSALCVLTLIVFGLYLTRPNAGGDVEEAEPKELLAVVPLVSVLPEEEEIESAQIIRHSPEPSEALEPSDLMVEISDSLLSGDADVWLKLKDEGVLSEEHILSLRRIAREQGAETGAKARVSEIGEIRPGKEGRWALTFENGEESRAYFTVEKFEGGWRVKEIVLPEDVTEVESDPLGVSHLFLKSVLARDFRSARSFVDPLKLSDARIAGLCIVCSEGGYHLREKKPLRALFQRVESSAVLATVENGSDDLAAELGLTLKLLDGDWRVTEVNLDSLLADYVERVAGGDSYFTPLLKNPSGGDTLVIYFEFDAGDLAPETEHQLQIVAEILVTDETKRIRLSGHTDALGSEDYNSGLSLERAQSVANYLEEFGVKASQITVEALGANQPRRSNTTSDGQDDPLGRRANRRTEIYLDF